ncbi:hypothetical protein BJ508DRAFT_336981 [Ascobolus immersus RN42]|uniref:Uncharacterized protein n=1 Tax=Ascobolus immersus RN42 TaxID=1160509 RepID=A0A3N4HBP1_ASCIM|nr:hypothetical protein BJ508DRAFT_336981 [Ascobolus immersus RN42]
MPCDREDHDHLLHNLVDWKRNDQSQLIRPCENICNFCYRKFNRSCSALRLHLLSGTGCTGKPPFRHPYAYHASHNPLSGRFRSDAPEEETVRRSDPRIRWYCRVAVENGIQEEENAVYYRILSNRLARRQLGTIEQLAQEASEFTVETPGLFLDQEFLNYGFGTNNTALPLIEFASFSSKMFEQKKKVTKAKKEARRAKMKVKEEEIESLATQPIQITSYTFQNGGFGGSFNIGGNQHPPVEFERDTKRLKSSHDTTHPAGFRSRREEGLRECARHGDSGVADIWNDNLNEGSIYDFPDEDSNNSPHLKLTAKSALEMAQNDLPNLKTATEPGQDDRRRKTPARSLSVLSLRSIPATPKRAHQFKRASPELEIRDSQSPTSFTASQTFDLPPYTNVDPKLLSMDEHSSHKRPDPYHAGPSSPPSASFAAKNFSSASTTAPPSRLPDKAQYDLMLVKRFRYSGVDKWAALSPVEPETAFGFFYRLKFAGLVPESHKMEPGSSSLYFRAEGEEGAKVLTDDETMAEVWNSPTISTNSVSPMRMTMTVWLTTVKTLVLLRFLISLL